MSRKGTHAAGLELRPSRTCPSASFSGRAFLPSSVALERSSRCVDRGVSPTDTLRRSCDRYREPVVAQRSHNSRASQARPQRPCEPRIQSQLTTESLPANGLNGGQVTSVVEWPGPNQSMARGSPFNQPNVLWAWSGGEPHHGSEQRRESVTTAMADPPPMVPAVGEAPVLISADGDVVPLPKARNSTVSDASASTQSTVTRTAVRTLSGGSFGSLHGTTAVKSPFRARTPPSPEVAAIPEDPFCMASIAARASCNPAIDAAPHSTSRLLQLLATTDGSDTEAFLRNEGVADGVRPGTGASRPGTGRMHVSAAPGSIGLRVAAARSNVADGAGAKPDGKRTLPSTKSFAVASTLRTAKRKGSAISVAASLVPPESAADPGLSNIARGFMRKLDATLEDMGKEEDDPRRGLVPAPKGSRANLIGRDMFRLPTRASPYRRRRELYTLKNERDEEEKAETAHEEYLEFMMQLCLQAKQLQRRKKFKLELDRVRNANQRKQAGRQRARRMLHGGGSDYRLGQSPIVKPQRGRGPSLRKMSRHSQSSGSLPSIRHGRHGHGTGHNRGHRRSHSDLDPQVREMAKKLPKLADFYPDHDHGHGHGHSHHHGHHSHHHGHSKGKRRSDVAVPWWVHPSSGPALLPSQSEQDRVTAFINETRRNMRALQEARAEVARTKDDYVAMGIDDIIQGTLSPKAGAGPKLRPHAHQLYSLHRVWTPESRESLRAARRASPVDNMFDSNTAGEFLDSARTLLRSRGRSRRKLLGGPESPKRRPKTAEEESSDDEDLFKERKSPEMRRMSREAMTEVQSFMAMVMSASELGTTPEPLGVVSKDKSWRGVINVSGYGMGDKGAQMLSTGLACMPKVVSLFLRNNRLTSRGACAIFSSTNPDYVTEIDVANNHIGPDGCRMLARHIMPGTTCLRRLNLTNNRLGDRAVQMLCRGLAKCPTLQLLLLRRNEIGRVGATALGELLESQGKSRQIRDDPDLGIHELDLAWNTITTHGAAALFTGLASNGRIQVLDVSFNTLGGKSHEAEEAVEAFANFIRRNKSLRHLNISHNQFSRDHFPAIEEAFNANHTITGLHVAGNEFYVDAHGFLQPRESADMHDETDEHKAQDPATKVVGLIDTFVSAVKGDDASGETGGGAGGGAGEGSDESKSPSEADAKLQIETDLAQKAPDVLHTETRIAQSDEALAAVAAGTHGTFKQDLAAIRDKVHEQEGGALRLSDEITNGHVRHRIIADLAPPSPTRQLRHKNPPVRESMQQHTQGFPADTCWICGGWRPFLFQWRVGASGPRADHVSVMTSYDGWRPIKLNRKPGGVFEIALMVPARRFHFVFLADGVVRAAQDELYERRHVPLSTELLERIAKAAGTPTAAILSSITPKAIGTESGVAEVLGTLGPDGYLVPGGVFVNFLGTAADEQERKRLVAVSKRNLLTKILGRWNFKGTMARTRELLIKEAEDEKKRDAAEMAAAEANLRAQFDSKEERMRRLISKFKDEVGEGKRPVESEGKQLERKMTELRMKVSSHQLLRKQPSKGQKAWKRAAKRVHSGRLVKPVSKTKHRFRSAVVPVAERPSTPPTVLPRSLDAACFGTGESDDEGAAAPVYTWKRSMSVFATATPPTAHTLSQAFADDWEMGKYPALIKDDAAREAVKLVCKEYYEVIISTFKYYAAYEATGSLVYNVGWNSFTGLCNSCKLVDNSTFTLSALDRVFLAANVLNQNYKFYRKDKERIPDRSLARFQFMEALVRVAVAKFCPAFSHGDAVRELLQRNLTPFAHHVSGNAWRTSALYLEEVDLVYRRHLDLLKNLYSVYSGRFVKPGETTFMSCEEWLDLTKQAKLGDEASGRTEREHKVSFVASMVTVVNEVKTDRHKRMSFVEFLEAVARVAATDQRPGALTHKLQRVMDHLTHLYSFLETQLHRSAAAGADDDSD